MEPEQIQKDLTHPYVTDNPEKVISSIEIHDNPYTAADTTHAIVICTEWDEFIVSYLLLTNYICLIKVNIYKNFLLP